MLQPDTLYLTPTPRLARRTLRTYAAQQSAAGQQAWHAPQVLTFSAWISQLRDDYYLLADVAHTPMSSEQALQIWRSIIVDAVFVNMPEIAVLAQQAWRLVHEHDLQPPAQWPELQLTEDARRFAQWARAYEQECHRRELLDEWTFASQLPALIAAEAIAVPGAVELVGFDLPPTPLQTNILTALKANGVRVTHPVDSAATTPAVHTLTLQAYPSPDDELRGAARWARALLASDPEQQIAIVVPDLAGRVDRVDRVFQQELDAPGFALQAQVARPWHISLGKRLSDWLLVQDALNLLQLAPGALSQPQLTQLLRCPLLPGWQSEATLRNATIVWLADRAPYQITLNELRYVLDHHAAGDLSDLLEQWRGARQSAPDSAMPSAWVRQFQLELNSVGFAAGRPLDSREYQVLQRWHELLEAMSALDLVSAPLSRRQALALLTERAGSVVFRERNPDAPIEILGVQEALGTRFAALWITSLDGATWPGAPQRNPLIPASVQAGVSRATSDGALAQAQRELDILLRSAGALQGSYVRGTEDIKQPATAIVQSLVGEVVEQAVAADAPPPPAPLAPALDDALAPPLISGTDAAETASGGTGVLSDQAACPFRAFAKHRLRAGDYRSPRPGLNAAQRGTLIHDALEAFWQDLPDSEALAQLDRTAEAARVTAAVTSTLNQLQQRFRLTLTATGRRLEQQRCERTLARWLQVERLRPPFRVVQREQDIRIALGALHLSGKLDRLDALAAGGLLLIDYKTGAKSRNAWTPDPRMQEPQLPAYAVSLTPTPEALAFANIKADVQAFSGVSSEPVGINGIRPVEQVRYGFADIDSWDALLSRWREDLNGLADAYLAGAAAVQPRSPGDCRYCHLGSLCRVAQRNPQFGLAESADAEIDE